MSAARTAKQIARVGVRRVAAASDRLVKPHQGVTVLGYHQVGAETPGGANVSVDAFSRQLAWLADRTRVISLSEAIDRLLDPDRFPATYDPRPFVVITFDDGTADFADNAVPMLERLDLPATLYLATSYPEEKRSFWDDGTILTWDRLTEITASGLIEIGSHTHSHVLLDRASALVIDDELDRSCRLIEDRLGRKAEHFAYPKALGDGLQADVAVRLRFRSAALAGGGSNVPGKTNPYRLARQPVLAVDNLETFSRKALGGLRLEGVLRDHLDRRRYRHATR